MTEIITEADIAGGERLLGLAYTATERAQMVGNLDGQRDLAIARRGVKLDNATPMATRFDPRLPGFAMPHGADLLVLRRITSPLPGNAENIVFAPLTHLSHWVRSGQITSRMLTDLYLGRIANLHVVFEC